MPENMTKFALFAQNTGNSGKQQTTIYADMAVKFAQTEVINTLKKNLFLFVMKCFQTYMIIQKQFIKPTKIK